MSRRIMYTSGGGFRTLLRHKKQTGFRIVMAIGNQQNVKLGWGDSTYTDVIGTTTSYDKSYAQPGEYPVTIPAALQETSNLGVNGQGLTYLNLALIQNLRYLFDMQDNLDLADVVWGKSDSGFDRFQFYNTGIRRADISGYTDICKSLIGNNCPNLEEVLLPSTKRAITNFSFVNCPKLRRLDMSRMAGGFTYFVYLYNSGLLAEVVPPPTMDALRLWTDNTKLNMAWPWSATFKAKEIRLNNTGMSQANVNANIIGIGQNRAHFDNTVNKYLWIHGTNAAPSGIMQAPAGYVQGGADGSPASAKEWIYVLVNQTNADGTSKYKWSISTN